MKTPSLLFQNIWSHLIQGPDRVLSYHRESSGRWIPVQTKSYLKNILIRVLVLKDLDMGPGDRLILSISSGYEFDLLEKASFCLGLNLLCVDRFTPTPLILSYFNSSDGILFLADEISLVSDIQEKVPFCKARQILLLDFRKRLKIYENEQLLELEKKVEETLAAHPGIDDRDFWDQLTCYTITTSGSSGSPKVICYSQKQVRESIHEISLFLAKISPGEVVISWLPMSNLFQRVFNLVALRLGALLYYEDHPKLLPSSLQEIRPSVLIGVPFFFDKIRRSIQNRIDTFTRGLLRPFPSLRTWIFRRALRNFFGGRIQFLISGSAAVPAESLLLYQEAGLPILEAYGMSECILPIAMNRLGDAKLGSVGRLLRPSDVQISPQGELLLKGPFLGKIDAAEPTTQGEHASKDYVVLDADAFLFIKGRGSDFIKMSTGRRVARQKLESDLEQILEVPKCILLGNEMSFLSAVVSPFDVSPQKTKEAQIQDPKSQSLFSESQKELWMQRLQSFNKLKKGYERLGLAIFLPRPFLVERNELTANLKYRFNFIEMRFRDQLQEQIQPHLKHGRIFGELKDGSWWVSTEIKGSKND